MRPCHRGTCSRASREPRRGCRSSPSPTSKPSFMPSSRCTSAIRGRPDVDRPRCAEPLVRAPAGRGSRRSRPRSARRRAGRPRRPSARSAPRPVISTSSPSTGNCSAECTALPNGSKIAATSRSIDGSWCQTLVIGSAMYSAKAPGPVHADAGGLRAQVTPARHAVAAPPAHDVPLARDQIARVEVGDVRPDLDDLADELVTDHERGRHGARRPLVPVGDVEVGAADARAVHPDQHVVDADRGLGHLGEREPGRRRCVSSGHPSEGAHHDRSCPRMTRWVKGTRFVPIRATVWS